MAEFPQELELEVGMVLAAHSDQGPVQLAISAIDGDMVNERFPQIRDRLGEDGMLGVDAIADAFWSLHAQSRSAWTLELDVRPFKENF